MNTLSEKQQNYINTWNIEFHDILQEICDYDLEEIAKFVDLQAIYDSHYGSCGCKKMKYVSSSVKTINQLIILLQVDNEEKLNLMSKGVELLEYALCNNNMELVKRIVTHKTFEYNLSNYIQKFRANDWYKHTPMYKFLQVNGFTNETKKNNIRYVYTLMNNSDRDALKCDLYGSIHMMQKVEYLDIVDKLF